MTNNSAIDYVYWDDPNELIDRLRLLIASQAALISIDQTNMSIDVFGRQLTQKDKKAQVVEELHRPACRNYIRHHIDIRGLDETWQADLVEMIPYSSVNNGYKYLLTIIDTFSEYAWAIPVKSKNGKDVTNIMKSVLVQKRHPQNLMVDQGREFWNKEFQTLMKEYNIHLYHKFSNLKASIVERLNRTLKNLMWKKFTLQGSYKWQKILPDILQQYNNTKHRTIKMKPLDIPYSSLMKYVRAAEKNTKIDGINVFKINQQNETPDVIRDENVFEILSDNDND
ncbi:uncharacterized protein LOC122850507 [Aphidius gifuensis]|uniref:uncharacterized protein LOC122850507 n=1 Tax=Aphidius gifuensis TaxID=684658 RepID=UPI001CDB6229|nr:uncharacterized protein LOC122850507 [Aphidius gifuensis]